MINNETTIEVFNYKNTEREKINTNSIMWNTIYKDNSEFRFGRT